ncbi:uncharacterized protein LOC131667193 [Phymastichus coffea]|uniref:uncharacterized protein LOC131667193 n=1 Tax=Phymastichus coffea TaxID=108790 RepID=UPI00273CA651|nr:uncharacterized protein LOC131667193 [Phymastichus coffea]
MHDCTIEAGSSVAPLQSSLSGESAEVTGPSFDELIFWYRPFLRIIGLLPFEARSFDWLGSRLHLAYCLAWSTVYWTSFVFYVVNGRRVPAIDTICETAVVVGVTVRYYMLLWRRGEFTSLIDECRAIWAEYDEEGRRAVRLFAQRIRLLFVLLLGSIHFTLLLFCTSTVALVLGASRQNDTQPRHLPYK